MELEEMKTLWENMSEKINHQNILTKKIIMEITQQKYRAKFSKLQFIETMGSVVCFVFGIYLIIHFAKLDTWYLQAMGVFILIPLFVLPFMTLHYLSKMKRLNLASFSYKETLEKFTTYKTRLLLTQRVGLIASVLFFFAVLPVANKVMNNKDMFATESPSVPWVFIGFVFVLLLFFMRWGYGKYKKITHAAENILKDLQDS